MCEGVVGDILDDGRTTPVTESSYREGLTFVI